MNFEMTSALNISKIPPEEDNEQELDIILAACFLCRTDRSTWMYTGRDINTGETFWRPVQESIGGIIVKRQWIKETSV